MEALVITSSTFVSQDSPQMSEEIFLAYLREHKPHLFDLELALKEVIGGTGFGSVVFKVNVAQGLITTADTTLIKQAVYVRRVNNKIV